MNTSLDEEEDNGFRKHNAWTILALGWFFVGWTISILPWIFLNGIFGVMDLILCTVLALGFWIATSVALFVCVTVFHKPKPGSEVGA